jgi:hypothetical protein
MLRGPDHEVAGGAAADIVTSDSCLPSRIRTRDRRKRPGALLTCSVALSPHHGNVVATHGNVGVDPTLTKRRTGSGAERF